MLDTDPNSKTGSPAPSLLDLTASADASAARHAVSIPLTPTPSLKISEHPLVPSPSASSDSPASRRRHRRSVSAEEPSLLALNSSSRSTSSDHRADEASAEPAFAEAASTPKSQTTVRAQVSPAPSSPAPGSPSVTLRDRPRSTLTAERSPREQRVRSQGDRPSSATPLDRDWREYEFEELQEEFPVGWEQRVTPAGVTYFVDHVHRTTTFEDPRIKANEQRRKDALEHEATLPQYKRDLRRKMLRLRDLFLHRRKQAFPTTVPKIDIFINREHIFEDSYRILMALSPTQLLGKLNIKFLNEDALDYGGVAREWFFQLSKEIFNPYYGLFEQLNSDQYLLNVSSHSGINPDHLSYFKFVGRVMGLAVVNGQFLDGCFVTTIYKMLLQKPVSLEDMAQVDVAFYNGLKWMLDNNITGVLENTFSDEKNVFGISETVELCPNGAAMPVTEENKSQYVKLIVKFRLVNGIDEQVQAMRRGFNEVVPASFLDSLDEKELELVLGGLSDIDVEDWMNNTEYRNCEASDQTVAWFWQAVKAADVETRARILQFVTGTSRVPITGFKDLRGSLGPKLFTIELVASAEITSLPKAHTCFNRLDLPVYASFSSLVEKLTIATEETMGFGIE
eukprot:m.762272 g.762272  ORF g.762272 m.762272 type:complete len:622 (+) comp59051_c0_seq2:1171-3036(+)